MNIISINWLNFQPNLFTYSNQLTLPSWYFFHCAITDCFLKFILELTRMLLLYVPSKDMSEHKTAHATHTIV